MRLPAIGLRGIHIELRVIKKYDVVRLAADIDGNKVEDRNIWLNPFEQV